MKLSEIFFDQKNSIPDAASGQFLQEGSLNWRVVLSKVTSLIIFLIIEDITAEDIAADTTTNLLGMSGEVT